MEKPFWKFVIKYNWHGYKGEPITAFHSTNFRKEFNSKLSELMNLGKDIVQEVKIDDRVIWHKA